MRHLYRKVDSKIATIGVIFPAGARYEDDRFPNGIAHMLEHMFFKGTKNRTANQINKEIGFLGGVPNAFTSDEEVMYHISVPYENLEQAIEILSDIILNPTFPEDEFLKEKEVVKEEALQYLQSENWRQHYFFSEKLIKGRMSKPIVGELSDIDSFTVDDVKSFYKEFCTSDRMIVGLSSNLEELEARDLMLRYFGKPDGKFVYNEKVWDSQLEGGKYLEFRWPTMEQVEYEMIFPSLRIKDFQYDAALRMMLTVLGGGMDSRLWTNIREERGLCYGIYAYAHSYADYGTFTVSASTREENIPLLRELIDKEIGKLTDDLVTKEELQRALNKYRLNTYAKNERSMSTLRSIMHREFYSLPSMDEFDKEIKSVTPEKIRDCARALFDYNKMILFKSVKGELE